MTQQQIKEGNKLIAEFIGMQKTEIGWYDFEEILNDGFSNTFDYLEFHSCWNWLMPVVIKICTKTRIPHFSFLLEFSACEYGFTNSCNFYDGECISPEKKIPNNQNELDENPLELVWKTVVEFIKTYNNGK